MADPIFSTSVEILYAIPIGILIAVLIATFYGKLTLPIGFIGVLIGIGLAWFLSPYTSLVMSPLANTIWYGYKWTLLEVFAVCHLVAVWFLASVGLYNLWRSGGIKVWA